MSRILLDQNVPFPLLRHLPAHDVVHAYTVGWGGLENGFLIAAAEEAGFAILVTCDRNLEYQQNLTGRRLALVVLETNHWPVIEKALDLVVAAVDAALPGSFASISFERPALRRRPPPAGYER